MFKHFLKCILNYIWMHEGSWIANSTEYFRRGLSLPGIKTYREAIILRRVWQ